MNHYKILPVVLLLLTVCPGLTAQQSNYKKQLETLDEYYENARTEWDVPGLAVGIVKDGEVIFAKGYGQREVGKNSPVDSKTMFSIASNTKAFTAAALAVLADQGKINWDDKVTDYLPWFKLYAPYVTENMTVRDLLCHRSGLATFSGDLIWYGTDYSRREVIRRARYLEPKYGFRAHFGYSNIMFLAAGEIIPAVTGTSWDDFVKQHFFLPLEMERTVTSTKNLDRFSNVAAPHTEHDGKTIAIEYLNWDNIAPAGGIISCVDDVLKWINLQLDRGVIDGDTIFSPSQSREMWSPNTITDVSGFSEKLMPSTFFKSYGLGWGLSNYKGRKIVGHSGGYDGMISYTCLVPEENLGFVILTNKNSSLYFPLVYKTLDIFLGGDQKDWNSIMLQLSEKRKQEQKRADSAREEARVKNTKPSLPLENYTGTYGGKLYGDAEVLLKDGRLVVQFVPAEKFRGKLSHWHYDTFEIVFDAFPSLPPGTCTFILDAAGKVSQMKIDVPNPDFDFTELKFYKKN